jgi:hypothetical protein
MVDKVALGRVFSDYFRFPCQVSFHQLLHIHLPLPSGAHTTGQLVAGEISGPSLNLPTYELRVIGGTSLYFYKF